MGTPSFVPADPNRNPYISGVLDKMTNGKEMRRLNVERQALLASLKATGLAQPATILNFNPVALGLDGGLGFKVPSIIDEAIKDEDRWTCKYDGREYKASVLTIREPKTFTQIRDVKVDDEIPSGVYDVKACKQIEIAHCLWTAYTLGMLGSAVGMGGVVAFQGDLKNLIQRDKNTPISIQVPTFMRLANNTREYYTEPKPLSECIGSALKLQRKYCNLQTQEAQSYWDQEDQRGNVTPIHRLWHQYELDMGWRQVAAPWITLSTENQITCVACGIPKKRVEAYFCTCGRVYDPMDAYMAREIPVTHFAMERILDADWPKIHKEEARRKAIREGKA